LFLAGFDAVCKFDRFDERWQSVLALKPAPSTLPAGLRRLPCATLSPTFPHRCLSAVAVACTPNSNEIPRFFHPPRRTSPRFADFNNSIV
jgi:hypothetical protein